MEFVGNGMGGILHKDSMSTVGEDDLSPDAIYGNKLFNLDQAMQDFESEEPAQQKQQQQTQAHRTPSLQSLSSSSSSSSSLSHNVEEVVVLPEDETGQRQTSLEVREAAKDDTAGVPITAPPLPLDVSIPPMSTMPRPMTPVL